MREIPHSELEKYADQSNLRDGLAVFGVEYDPGRREEGNSQRLRVLRALQARSVLEVREGQMVFDPEALEKQALRGSHSARGQDMLSFTSEELFTSLRGLQAYSKQDVETGNHQLGNLAPREVIALPRDLNSLTTTYPEQQKKLYCARGKLAGRSGGVSKSDWILGRQQTARRCFWRRSYLAI